MNSITGVETLVCYQTGYAYSLLSDWLCVQFAIRLVMLTVCYQTGYAYSLLSDWLCLQFAIRLVMLTVCYQTGYAYSMLSLTLLRTLVDHFLDTYMYALSNMFVSLFFSHE